MDLLKRIKGLNVFGKKVFVFGVLFVLAIPLLFLIANNFQKRMAKLENKQFLEGINPVREKFSNSNGVNLPNINKESGTTSGQTPKEIEEVLKILEEISKEATTSTSTL